MLTLPNAWSTELLYKFLSSKTLAEICQKEKLIDKYITAIDWNIKSKQKMDSALVIKYWEYININDFLDRYESADFITLKKLGIKLAKYVQLIKNTARYQQKLVTEQFTYEFPDFVDFKLLIQTKKLSEQFLLDFWYNFNLVDVYEHQNISFNLFRKIYLEEVERFKTHGNLSLALENTTMQIKILSDQKILETIDMYNAWDFLPNNIPEKILDSLLKIKNLRNRHTLIEHICKKFPLSYDFLKNHQRYLNFQLLIENENLKAQTTKKEDIHILKHNGNYYILKLNGKKHINFLESN